MQRIHTIEKTEPFEAINFLTFSFNAHIDFRASYNNLPVFKSLRVFRSQRILKFISQFHDEKLENPQQISSNKYQRLRLGNVAIE